MINTELLSSLSTPNPNYHKRAIAPAGLWEIDDWKIKAYGIHYDANRPIGEILHPGFDEDAKRFIRGQLPVAEHEGHHNNCGFAIIHQGTEYNWLVFNWWAHNFICCEALARCKSGETADFNLYTGPAMACVWEMVIIEHEKKAWISSALTENGSVEDYLGACLSPGRY